MNSTVPEQFVNMNTIAQAPTTVIPQLQPGQQSPMQVPLHPGQQPQQPPQQQQQQLANQQQQQQPQPSQNPFRNFPPIPVTSQSMSNAVVKAPASGGMAKPQSSIVAAISSQAQQATQQQQIATQNNTSPLAVRPFLCNRSIGLDLKVLGTFNLRYVNWAY